MAHEFKKQNGRPRFRSAKRGLLTLRTIDEKSPQGKATLISIFWRSRVYLDYSIVTDKIGRIEFAESSLQIWA